MYPQNISHREPRANAASQSDSPATGAATFPAQHTTIGIDICSSCCSFLATQTMVCSKMKDKIWQKARDKKHFIRDEIYWWQRERTLMGHAHILWVLLSAARIAVRALNCITYHVAEPVGVWNGLCAPASKPSNLIIKFMCVHFGRITNCDRICIEFRVDKFYQHKFFGCDIKIYWCVLMPRLNEFVGDRSSLFNLKKIIHSFNHSFILGSGLSYTLPCLRPGLINQSSNPNAYIAGTMEPYNYGHP